jgi:hypothetical protein
MGGQGGINVCVTKVNEKNSKNWIFVHINIVCIWSFILLKKFMHMEGGITINSLMVYMMPCLSFQTFQKFTLFSYNA